MAIPVGGPGYRVWQHCQKDKVGQMNKNSQSQQPKGPPLEACHHLLHSSSQHLLALICLPLIGACCLEEETLVRQGTPKDTTNPCDCKRPGNVQTGEHHCDAYHAQHHYMKQRFTPTRCFICGLPNHWLIGSTTIDLAFRQAGAVEDGLYQGDIHLAVQLAVSSLLDDLYRGFPVEFLLESILNGGRQLLWYRALASKLTY